MFALQLPGREQQILLQELQQHIWIQFPWLLLQDRYLHRFLGKDSFQEVDITGITMPITKHNYIVKDVTKLADIVREAFIIAKEGRPGPVLIDICKDVTAAVTEFEHKTCQRTAR